MATQTLSCPYCNSTVVLISPVGVGQRVHCPRCHELFPYRAGERGSDLGDYSDAPGFAPVGPALDGVSELPYPARRRSNRSVAAVVLGVMVTMAAIGLAFAWVTTKERRQRDHLGGEITVISIAPAKLAALGYVPSDSNVIAGLHVAELLGNPVTQELLARGRPGTGGLGLNNLAQWTGIKLENLDHAVLGVQLENRFPPRIILVVRTRQPYDAAEVRTALKSSGKEGGGKRKLDRFPLGQTQLQAVLWCADERTLVFGLTPADLEEVPLTPTPGAERFAPAVQKLLTEQMSEGTPAWAVGQAHDWPKLLRALALLKALPLHEQQLKEVQALLAKLHSFGTWFQAGEDVTWHLDIETTDPAAAQELNHGLARAGLEQGKPLPFFENQPRTETLARELSQTLTRTQQDRWVRVQAKASLAAIRQALAPQP